MSVQGENGRPMSVKTTISAGQCTEKERSCWQLPFPPAPSFTCSACRRPSLSGGGTYSTTSKRPGLRGGQRVGWIVNVGLASGQGHAIATTLLFQRACSDVSLPPSSCNLPPYLTSAASSACGLLVAPMTSTPCASSNPSISVRKEDRMRAVDSPVCSPSTRLPAGGECGHSGRGAW